jgi:Bifunctional DNA primase/polymerase, N-terminal/Primase C terminal 1 (PriCT-1)
VSGCAATALEYAARGWRVFPLNGKVPLAGTRGCRDASSDPSLVARWPDGANVGVATGNGLVVLDVDGDVGAESLHELAREHGGLPATVSAVTGGGGEHFYFRTEAPVRNSAGKLAPGLDVRGEGGYVVAPPSLHPSGRRYEWDDPPGCAPLAPLPTWLGRLLELRGNGRALPVSEWRALARGVARGARNDACARLTGHLLARGVDPFVALELVLAWNRHRNRPPLSDDEAARVVNSIARREASKWS